VDERFQVPKCVFKVFMHMCSFLKKISSPLSSLDAGNVMVSRSGPRILFLDTVQILPLLHVRLFNRNDSIDRPSKMVSGISDLFQAFRDSRSSATGSALQ